MPTATSHENVAELAMDGSHPALPAEPGTLKASLPDTPGITQMTEKESAHPAYQQLDQIAVSNGVVAVNLNASGSNENVQNGDNKVEATETMLEDLSIEPEKPKTSPTNSVQSPGAITRSVNTVSNLLINE